MTFIFTGLIEFLCSKGGEEHKGKLEDELGGSNRIWGRGDGDLECLREGSDSGCICKVEQDLLIGLDLDLRVKGVKNDLAL